ncbi:PAS domain S-box-containing protein/diguanylate cyclase (GGDEF)-like protein [Motilibacter rhizosphaerae]|uniref:PAS domain S-box-containing protein/diguanylate cyclase (GGDEF)-like protein n=1 Tax=Motilibacter rhizosphaerae TaxID=598652 RepID=A0A4Q7NSW9_9ACTN|nr:PAS domain S-box-containing protein/diguanylate cyclase (GGDEF)-like protein [Motilibacter rhizosphaerae]
MLGVLTPLLSGGFFGGIIAGASRAAARAGGSVLGVQTLDAHPGDVSTSDTRFTARMGWDTVSGFLVVTTAVDDDYLEALSAAGRPYVLVGRAPGATPAPWVSADNAGGARLAVEHLLAHGHRQLAFVGELDQADVAERYAAFRAALDAAGVPHDPALAVDVPNMMESGGAVGARALLAAGLPATAVVTGNDYGAIGLVETLLGAGVRVPEDVAVVGFDDTTVGASLQPPLSSARQDFVALGEVAADLLVAQAAGVVEAGAPVRHVLPTVLRTRESCGCGRAVLTAPATPVVQGTAEGPGSARAASRSGSARAASGPGSTRAASGSGSARAAEDLGADELVAELVAHGSEPRTAQLVVAQLLARLRAAVEGRPDHAGLLASAARLQPDQPRWETSAVLLAAAQAFARAMVEELPEERRAAAGAATDAVVLELAGALTRAQLDGEVQRTATVTSALRSEYDITLELLRGDQEGVSLGWLARTPARSALLARWTQVPGELDVVGGYERSGRAGRGGQHAPHGAPPRTRVGVVRTEEFPPAELHLLVAGQPGQMVAALPLHGRERDWGVLAVVGPVESTTVTGREGYHAWASLLGLAHDRAALVAGLRESEERYALAMRAANDGLWDWDLASGRVFYSERWAAMLGRRPEELTCTPADWLELVHEDDAPALEAVLDQCRLGLVDTFEVEQRVRTGDGEQRWMLCRALAVPGGGLPATRLVGAMSDVTERRQLEDELRQAALYDTVTGLPNKALFLDRLSLAMSSARRRRQDGGFAVLFLDLDGFKVINDSLGHMVGDALLVRVAERLRGPLRETDTAARFGGDEFAVLLSGVEDADGVATVVSRLQEALEAPYEVDGHLVSVTASLGVTLGPGRYERPEDLLRDADIAMYSAKARERGSWAVFAPSMHATAVDRLRTETELRTGIERGQLRLAYQPIVDLRDGGVVGSEALARWGHPERGLVPPSGFLAVAEETGLIIPLGRMLVQEAAAQVAAWHREGRVRPGFRVSINVSNREFWQGAYPARLLEALEAAQVDPGWVAIEITETVIMHSAEQALPVLSRLKQAGLRLHVDDFGTGYSSLETLHRFPVDALKIDRSFVARLDLDERSTELVRTIVTMGRNLGVEVIAEGIETARQAERLVEMGCEYGQGYLWAQPLPAAEFAALLAGEPLPGVP